MRCLRELMLMMVVCQGLATPLSLSGTLGPDGTDEDGNPEVLSSLTLLHEDSSDCQVGDGASYRGTVSVTESGKTCQRWDSQEPHEHSRTLANYPSAGLEQNYCRNPDGWTEVWCYTTDPDTRYERCDVRDCADWLARDQAWAVGSSGAVYSFGGLTFDAGKVLDGDTSTYWNPYGLERYYNNWYIVLDLRVPYSLFRVGIANFGDDIHDIKAFTLQRSGSGYPYSWENVTSADDIVAGTDEWQERGGFAATARHWRLLISQTHKGWQPWLLELGLYGFRVLADAPPGYAVFRKNCIRHRNQLGTERDSSVQRCAVSCDLLLACRSFDFNFHHLTCSLSTDTRDSAAQAYENCPARFQQQTDYYEKQDHPQTKDVPAPTYYNPLDHESTFSTPNGHTLDEGVGVSALQLESRRSQYANLGSFAGTCFGSTLNCPRGFTLAFWFKRPAGDNRPQYYINSGGHDFTRTRGFTLTKTVADLDNDLYNVAVNGRLCRHEAKVYLLADRWTHVAVTWLEERGLEIFVDGRVQLVAVLGTEIPPLENDPYTDVFLGTANTQPGEHTGEAMFDELKFWDWVLSDGQLQLAMIPGSVESSVCTDQRDHCQGWAAEGNCNNNYQSYMRQYCPRSCGFCSGPTDSTVNEDAADETPMMSPERACGDRNQYCVSWASQGYCRTNYAYMVQSCRRACGFCTVTSGGTGGGSMTNTNCMDNHYHCPSWATRGFCAPGNSHHTYMMRYCRKSCRKCGTEGTGTGTGGHGGGMVMIVC
ncbi:uncharacterized protein LOC118417664 [Branchiostoma floridae]|uniref:Uncharacterized protein LOC118417664 n=1 Tax=Branchiostoma floridae TaxID=7739 RepID=A0A9J7LAQ0_BRAFL|nr:uncharacterized protein LOC118417664 [Branchiostoma floridae]